jgi:uncharacterized pyridoxamine 5'-phosphate oxidase family protein
VYETNEEVAELQGLLDRSYAAAGSHLLSIHTENWRVSAEKLCELLQGMCVLNLATVSSKGEPAIAPVDGQFYRGRWYFGSSRTSVRAKHIKAQPAVAVAHTRGEELSVTTHGIAREFDRSSERALGYRRLLEEIYGGPMTEDHWEGDDIVYWELQPKKMFAIAPQV